LWSRDREPRPPPESIVFGETNPEEQTLMRILLSTSALALVLGFAAPASAQMCGGGNVGQAPATAQSGPTAQSSGMAGMGMCGGMMGQRQQVPTAEEMLEGKTAKPQQSAMCACCRNMAMMRGGQPDSGGGMTCPAWSSRNRSKGTERGLGTGAASRVMALGSRGILPATH
jgi:hypothetical protein